MLVDAVAGLQKKNKEPATKYLQFVQEHRGKAVAMKAKARLVKLRDEPGWEGCALWKSNGYKPTKRARS